MTHIPKPQLCKNGIWKSNRSCGGSSLGCLLPHARLKGGNGTMTAILNSGGGQENIQHWSHCTCLISPQFMLARWLLRRSLDLGHMNRIAAGINCSRDLHHLASKLFCPALVIELIRRTIRVYKNVFSIVGRGDLSRDRLLLRVLLFWLLLWLFLCWRLRPLRWPPLWLLSNKH